MYILVLDNDTPEFLEVSIAFLNVTEYFHTSLVVPH
jgi:hypothetical protein